MPTHPLPLGVYPFAVNKIIIIIIIIIIIMYEIHPRNSCYLFIQWGKSL